MGARLQVTPLSRTLAKLESDGYLADVVERGVGPIKRDLFGCWDVLAIAHDGRVLLVQCTDSTNVSKRMRKCEQHPLTRALISRGIGLEVWGWSYEDVEPRIERL